MDFKVFPNLHCPIFSEEWTIDRIQSHDIHELKIAENFNEFLGENVEDEEIKFDDTEAIVNTYIDAVDTDLDKDMIKSQVRELMVEAQALEIA